jgi:predicted nucleotidyltransferase
MNSNEILYRIKTGITAKDPGAEVYLYGSRARGDNRDNSDWDILVIASKEKVTVDYELDLREPVVDIELETGESISLLVYSRSEWENKMPFSPLFSNINKEGIKI